MKAWARYRPSFSKNNDMFDKKRRNDDDDAKNKNLETEFWDESFLNNLLS